MNTPRDGGPAFPRPDFHSDTHFTAPAQDGMSLRDWFAGHALVSIIGGTFVAAQLGKSVSTEQAVCDAYIYADAMLAERAKAVEPTAFDLAKNAVEEAHKVIDDSGLLTPRAVSHVALPARIEKLIALISK